MRLVIKTALDAIDNLPTGNAGITTLMKYHKDVLAPATDALRKLLSSALSQDELNTVAYITQSYEEGLSSHVLELDRFISFMDLDIDDEELDKTREKLEYLKSANKKILKLCESEEVENLCAAQSSKN